MSEGVDTPQGLSESHEAIMGLFGGKVVYEMKPDEDIPTGLRDLLATWPGIADDPNWNNHPQLLAHIERGEFKGCGKWVYRNKKQVFLKDYNVYKFDEQLRCWR